MKPWIHAESSAKKWGGEPAEYFEVHDFMDCSKGAFPTNAHRTLTHNAWFIKNVLERVKFSNSCEPVGNSFPCIILANGRRVSVRDIGEQHILEDFGMRFMPSAQDYLQELAYQPWMGNERGALPPSFKKAVKSETVEFHFKPSLRTGESLMLDGVGPMLERRKREAQQTEASNPCCEIELPDGAKPCALNPEITKEQIRGFVDASKFGGELLVGDGTGLNKNLLID